MAGQSLRASGLGYALFISFEYVLCFFVFLDLRVAALGSCSWLVSGFSESVERTACNRSLLWGRGRGGKGGTLGRVSEHNHIEPRQ